MKQTVNSNIIVIFGASGDLAKRKLIPAIYSLYKQDLLPQDQLVLGAGRTEISDSVYQKQMEACLLQEFPKDEKNIKSFCKQLSYQSLDTSNSSEYIKIKDRLLDLRQKHKIENNILFYLSTPPSLYYIIPKSLAEAGLNDESDGYKRIIIEKPFGHDGKSAKDLNKHLLCNYNELQLYRIDHYLGKETVQNLLVFRFANSMFEPLWNENHIENVQIYANESIGIEDRGGYYDKSGAIRDMIQNHMLQLLGIVGMEPPAKIDAYSIRNEIVKVLQSVRINKTVEDIEKNLVIGQYLGNNELNSYREEKNVSGSSYTETYAALRLFIDNWRWNNVPFYIRTGKRLQKRASEVVINFKNTPHPFFSQLQKKEHYKNQLVIRIQPDEGIKMTFAAKEPGSGFHTHEMEMAFYYSDFSNIDIPPAYERLILDALLGDGTLFARNDAVEACWNIVDPTLKFMQDHAADIIEFYESGSHGPKGSDRLLAELGHKWRNPCLSFKGKDC